MKLAEALQERADLNRRIEQLRSRLDSNALVQEGEKPAEEPEQLLRELDGCVERLEELMAKINRTNCETVVEGKTLTEMIARKDALLIRLSAYRDLVNTASQTARRATRSEIKIFSTINVQDKQRMVDEMAKELRLLDNKLQATNWTVDLKED